MDEKNLQSREEIKEIRELKEAGTLSDIRKRVLELLFSYDPPEKNYVVRFRMQYLALLAQKVLQLVDGEETASREELLVEAYNGFIRNYLACTAPEKDAPRT